ncbi:hypothetical protein DL240490_01932 [Mycobacterium marinum]|nr:hypothetical protein DL240490_01932 [Mycobacterium marinum]
MAIWVSGRRVALTPPASARSVSRRRRLWHARWIADKDDEQAVSIAAAGPRSPSR